MLFDKGNGRHINFGVPGDNILHMLDKSIAQLRSKKLKKHPKSIIFYSFLGNDINEAIRIAKCNYTGILKWIIEIAKPERLNLKSRLWIFSSVAGDIGRVSNYNYGAAKSAITTYSNGIYLRCINKPFAVRIFKAGYISTRMTIGKAPKYLCMNTKDLAKLVLNFH